MAATGKLANARKIRTSVSPELALAFVIFIVLLRPSMSDKRSQANFQIFPFLVGRCFQRLEASQTPLGKRVGGSRVAGQRVSGSAGQRVGVRGSKTAFRHGDSDQEVSTELMMLGKRRHADTPIRPYVSPHDGPRSLTLRLPGQTVDETEIRLARRRAAGIAAGNSRPIRS
jgi:hypothetical protein